jgi:CheY-like chemotaxis protein
MNIDMVPVRILVVDDDAVSREIIAMLLEQAGYAVETADSGEAALLQLSAATSGRPAVVLTDLQMPGIAGVELARRLRGLGGAGTVLLAMSGSEPAAAVQREFDGFLLKPFTMAALEAVIGGRSGEKVHGAAGRDVSALDEDVFRKLAGSMRGERLEQLYALCLSDAETRIAGMRRAASDGDDAGYKRAAHAIRGSCSMVGAVELQTLATSMEERGLGNANHVASLDEFMLACERLRRILIAHARGENVPETQGEDAP